MHLFDQTLIKIKHLSDRSWWPPAVCCTSKVCNAVRTDYDATQQQKPQNLCRNVVFFRLGIFSIEGISRNRHRRLGGEGRKGWSGRKRATGHLSPTAGSSASGLTVPCEANRDPAQWTLWAVARWQNIRRYAQCATYDNGNNKCTVSFKVDKNWFSFNGSNCQDVNIVQCIQARADHNTVYTYRRAWIVWDILSHEEFLQSPWRTNET